jgi:peptidylprolyl isomerase
VARIPRRDGRGKDSGVCIPYLVTFGEVRPIWISKAFPETFKGEEKMKTLTAGFILMTISMPFLLGCSAETVAKEGDTVKVHYTGKLEDGTVFDSSREREQFELTLGSGGTIPGFENGITGMAVGETKTITIPPEEAYGPKRDELVMTISKDEFPSDVEPSVGQQMQMRHPSGNVVTVTIIDVMQDSVTFDANHPLAGKTLIFEVELMEIK